MAPPPQTSTLNERATPAPVQAAAPGKVASAMKPLIDEVFGVELPLRLDFWDGSSLAPSGAVATLHFKSPDSIRRLLWMPNELGLARAYVSGDIELSGQIFDVVVAFRDAKPEGVAAGAAVRALPKAIKAARRAGAFGGPLQPPPEEARVHGWRHSLRRDEAAVTHHYDVGNDFYRLVLGPMMTYSCARFTEADSTLEEAQAAKHELICRKLGLPERPGSRMLDVGCGWGSMAIHAAQHHGARSVGITLSRPQAELARRRAEEAGVGDRVEIRVQDYRELGGETFDAISSIGMSEHVGHAKIDQYFATLRSVLRPQGRLLNHAITSVGGSKLGRNSFVGRYVFPDGELIDVGKLVLAMEGAGFEVRDVESLREHYARTLRAWVANLESNWNEAVSMVGEPRTKVWHLYMAGSAVGFEDGGISIHQILGVLPGARGESGMPPTRRDWG
ncbi:MAG TPA: cyclopropane-fatty-acyl-phospholipid synthase family protein [Ilumatobacteraceae bacterium]|nr:cyclopropane-fatty-acyl-phospholipid synthase family protein [Ilumatobacteraceae bacterium]